MSINLSTADKTTIRTAAYGAVDLLSFAGVAGSPHKISTKGFLALTSATGAVGHALAEKRRGEKLNYTSGAALADQVLPALTASVKLLAKADAAEAENFRGTVLTAVEAAAQAGRGEPTPPLVAMVGKIKLALGV